MCGGARQFLEMFACGPDRRERRLNARAKHFIRMNTGIPALAKEVLTCRAAAFQGGELVSEEVLSRIFEFYVELASSHLVLAERVNFLEKLVACSAHEINNALASMMANVQVAEKAVRSSTAELPARDLPDRLR